MLPQILVVQSSDFARLSGQVLFQKVLEATLANKANASGVFFVKGHQIMGFSDTPDCGFLQLTEREQTVSKLGACNRLQKIALVLAGIKGFQ